jgi:hypothetical protein
MGQTPTVSYMLTVLTVAIREHPVTHTTSGSPDLGTLGMGEA